jgi:hypothetical protein
MKASVNRQVVDLDSDAGLAATWLRGMAKTAKGEDRVRLRTLAAKAVDVDRRLEAMREELVGLVEAGNDVADRTRNG